MNLLFVTDTFPYRLNSGGKIVSYQILKTLARKYNIHLLSLADRRPTSPELAAITSLGIKVDFVVSQKPYRLSVCETLYYILHLRPFFLFHYFEPLLAKRMTKILKTESFDVIHVDHVYMAQYLPGDKKQHWILSTHDIEYKLHYDFFDIFQSSAQMRFTHAYNAITLWIYERNIFRRFDQIIVLSKEDRKQIIAMGIESKKIVIFTVWQKILRMHHLIQPNELLFVGNIWWPPNYDAMTWFIKNIMPLLQERLPSVSLTIVGSESHFLRPLVRQMDTVKLVGATKDLTPYLKKAAIFIIPIRIAAGIRVKALNAFGWSLPLISTAKGVQGLEVNSEKHYLRAETAKMFVSQIERLMTNSVLRTSLIQNAKRYLEIYHNPTTVQQKLLKTYAKK